jgi:hypothetical protein
VLVLTAGFPKLCDAQSKWKNTVVGLTIFIHFWVRHKLKLPDHQTRIVTDRKSEFALDPQPKAEWFSWPKNGKKEFDPSWLLELAVEGGRIPYLPWPRRPP